MGDIFLHRHCNGASLPRPMRCYGFTGLDLSRLVIVAFHWATITFLSEQMTSVCPCLSGVEQNGGRLVAHNMIIVQDIFCKIQIRKGP